MGSFDFDPQGRYLASASEDDTIRIWEVETGKAVHTLAGLQDSVYSVQFSSDGKLLASAGTDGAVRLWDWKAGKLHDVIQIGPKQGKITALSFSPEGRHLVTANGNATSYVLRLKSRPKTPNE